MLMRKVTTGTAVRRTMPTQRTMQRTMQQTMQQTMQRVWGDVEASTDANTPTPEPGSLAACALIYKGFETCCAYYKKKDVWALYEQPCYKAEQCTLDADCPAGFVERLSLEWANPAQRRTCPSAQPCCTQPRISRIVWHVSRPIGVAIDGTTDADQR